MKKKKRVRDKEEESYRAPNNLDWPNINFKLEGK